MKKKLLVVDDEPDVLQFLRKRLERNNFMVTTASNGQDCLNLAFKEEPDLILLDIIMPFMDGYEVVKRLRDNSKTKHIPIILHSVKKETKSIFKGMEMGCIDYVIKPVRFETLLRVIRRYV